MRNVFTLLIPIFCAINTLHAQEFDFKTNHFSINEIDSVEKQAGGKRQDLGSHIRFTISKNYFPGADKYSLANPITFFRGDPLRLVVQYYYSLPDGIIRLAEFTLNRADTALLKKVFNNNASKLTGEFGNPVSDKNEQHDTWWGETTIWENGNTHIEQFIIIGSGTYRVRVLVSWK